jgi:hypothetical protein
MGLRRRLGGFWRLLGGVREDMYNWKAISQW